MPSDVFISHSARDKEVAKSICSALEEAAIRCWVAPRDVRPGKSFPGEITRAIQHSKVMLLIFSRHSNSSEQVLREVQLAVDSHLPIVRLRVEDIPLSDDLRYYLSTPHWLDALTPPLSKHIPPLVAAIKELLGGDEAMGAAAVPVRSSLREPDVPVPVTAPQPKSFATWGPRAIAGVLIVVTALAFAFWTRWSKRTQTIVSPKPPSESTPDVSPSLSAPAIVAPLSPTPSPLPPTPSPVSPTSSSSLPEKSATPAPSPSSIPAASNKNAPSARNHRSWQQWIDEFVHNFIASNETNDLDLAVSFYAADVDLFEEGRKPIDAIRRDIESYNARWTTRRATIRGDVKLTEKTPNRAYAASFEHDYYVDNPTRGEWINGAVAVELQITVGNDGIPKIYSMKQKTLRKEKGTMQSKPTPPPEQSANRPQVSGLTTASASPATPLQSPPTSPIEAPEDGTGQAGLVRIRNTRYGFSALIPKNVFPNPPSTFTADRQSFTSSDGRAILTLYVERNGSVQHLRESYNQWSAQHTKSEPDKIVDYKVLRDNWFVVSGQKNGRGFYLKAIAKSDVLEFMYLDCDENHYPVNQETLTAMSRSFDGN